MSTKKTTFKSNFGVNLKMARKEGGWNQGGLAAELGISRDTLSRYERGELSPSLEVFTKMLELFATIDIDAINLLSETSEQAKQDNYDIVNSWGWARGLNFASGGAFRVGAAHQDILRLVDILVKKLPDDNPFKEIPSEMRDYICDLVDDCKNESNVTDSFELLVPIAHHAVSFKVELPETQSTKNDKIFAQYLEEKSRADKLQEALDKLGQ